jgi:hypothetical protein
MKLGFLGDINKSPGEPFLIPESCLLLPNPQKIKEAKPIYIKPDRRRRFPIASLDEARGRYNRRNETRKIHLSFDELKDLFDQGATLREIGLMTGVSWQAISQIYKKYFAPFSVSNKERQHNFVRDRQIKKAEEHFLSIEKMAKMTEIVTNLGMDVEPIVINRLLTRCNTYRVIVNDRLCGVYHLTSTHNPPGLLRSYHRINLSRNSVSKLEFIIFFIGDDLNRVFVIPSKIILNRYNMESEKSWKTFYIPTEKLPPYKNQYPIIDYWKYENRWDLLKGESDE